MLLSIFSKNPPDLSKCGNKSRELKHSQLPVFHLIFVIALFLVPLVRFLFFENYEIPFTDPDQSAPISSDVQFLVEPSYTVCSVETNLLIIIVSKPAENGLREKIRKSWGNPVSYNRQKTRLLFLMGIEDSNIPDSLIEENHHFDDIIVSDVQENYYNLSLKTFALLQYKDLRCPQVNCLVKADSDNVLNIGNFERLCEKRGISSTIMGNCDVSRRVLRSGSKWAVPTHVYPFSKYSQYCSAGSYLLTGKNTAFRIAQTTMKTIFFDSSNMRMLPEDVLFTGIFAQMAGVERENLPGFSFFDRPEYRCVNGSYLSYSLHMNRAKNPAQFWKQLRAFEGQPC